MLKGKEGVGPLSSSLRKPGVPCDGDFLADGLRVGASASLVMLSVLGTSHKEQGSSLASLVFAQGPASSFSAVRIGRNPTQEPSQAP